MATLEDGIYTILKAPSDLAATLPRVDPGETVVLLPPNAAEAASQRVGSLFCSYSRICFYDFFFRLQWEVKRTPKGTYTITNRGNFLSFDGEPGRGKKVQGDRPPREWSLYKATDRFAYQ
jgi:hypothetical protein